MPDFMTHRIRTAITNRKSKGFCIVMQNNNFQGITNNSYLIDLKSIKHIFLYTFPTLRQLPVCFTK